MYITFTGCGQACTCVAMVVLRSSPPVQIGCLVTVALVNSLIVTIATACLMGFPHFILTSLVAVM